MPHDDENGETSKVQLSETHSTDGSDGGLRRVCWRCEERKGREEPRIKGTHVPRGGQEGVESPFQATMRQETVNLGWSQQETTKKIIERKKA